MVDMLPDDVLLEIFDFYKKRILRLVSHLAGHLLGGGKH
jgi:hypothetical protein